MAPIKTWLSLLAIAAFTQGCWVKKTMCRGLHNQMPDSCRAYTANPTESSTETSGAINSGAQPDSSYATPNAPTVTSVNSSAVPGFALSRVTPEQLSNNIASAVNYGTDPDELRWYNEYTGQTQDYLQLLFGVSLGGVDFETSSKRDPTTKAQTLLVSRVVAMLLTQASMGKEWGKAAGERVVFNKCDITTDRPLRASDSELPADQLATVKEQDARWNAQVEELFFRFYARPPSTTEIAAVKDAFLTAMDAEGYPYAGWVPVVYAMLASQEFWHQ